MEGQTGLQHRFLLAVEQLIKRATQECGYLPEEYIRTGANRLLSEPVSDDSMQLWARGRADLTIESLARHEEWKELFTGEEREAAERRYMEWSSAPLAEEIVSNLLAGISHPL